MRSDFKHYVITRFNISLHWPENASVEPNWLDYRFEIFEKLCFPSIENQNVKNFTWLVLFDSNTPSKIRSRVEILQKKLPQLKPLYLPRHESGIDRHYLVSTRYSEMIKRDGGLDSKYLITTRIDNDDAISANFIEDIQSNFSTSPQSFINFTDGYLYDIKNGKIVRSKANDGTNTITYIEECIHGQHAKTVYFFDHHRNAAEFAPVINLSNHPSWIIGVHQNNLMNNMEIHPVVSDDLNWKDYEWRKNFGSGLPLSLGN